MRIDVTQDCIGRARQGTSRSCPVALAMTDGGLMNVEVWGGYLRWGEDHPLGFRKKYCRIPKWLVQRIRHYDTHGKMEPFSLGVLAGRSAVLLGEGE